MTGLPGGAVAGAWGLCRTPSKEERPLHRGRSSRCAAGSLLAAVVLVLELDRQDVVGGVDPAVRAGPLPGVLRALDGWPAVCPGVVGQAWVGRVTQHDPQDIVRRVDVAVTVKVEEVPGGGGVAQAAERGHRAQLCPIGAAVAVAVLAGRGG